MKNIDKNKKNELDPKKCELLDKVAVFILKRKLDLPATLLIESTMPIHFLSAQFLLFIEPFLTIIFKEEDIKSFRESIEDKRYAEYLIEKINED